MKKYIISQHLSKTRTLLYETTHFIAPLYERGVTFTEFFRTHSDEGGNPQNIWRKFVSGHKSNKFIAKAANAIFPTNEITQQNMITKP